MRPLIATALLSLLLSTTASGQLVLLGDWFPLTNTRYGARTGTGELVTDGRSEMLFWTTGADLRVTKLVEGERRGGRAILPVNSIDPASWAAIWTGRQYLAAASELLPTGAVLNGRLLDPSGEPLGPAFQLLPNAHMPELATNGRNVLMLYREWGTGALRFAVLDHNGILQRATTRLLTSTDEVASRYAIASNGTGYAAVVATNFATRMFFFDEHAQLVSDITIPSTFRDALSITSNGSTYFVAGASTPDQGVHMMLVTSSGQMAPELFTNHSGFVAQIATSWTGSAYAVALGSFTEQLRFLFVDSTGRTILGNRDVIGGSYPSIVTTAGGRVTASWRDEQGLTRVAQLPRAGEDEGTIVTHGASDQEILATATGDEGTLVVWREVVDLEQTWRAGIRTRDGAWIERLLTPATHVDWVSAASNGNDFAVALKPGNESEAVVFRLDSRLRTSGTTRLPFSPFDMTWRGNDYLIAGWSSGALALATLTPSGVLSPTRTVPGVVASARIASTNGFTLISTIIPGECPILCPVDWGNVATMQLDASLNPVTPLHDLGSFSTGPARVTVDGNDFIVAWAGEDGVKSARIRAGSAAAPVVQTVVPWHQSLEDAYAVKTPQGLIYTWLSTNANVMTRYLELFPRDGGASRRTSIPLDTASFPSSIVTTLANGDVAVLASLPNRAAPHHGSMRILMRVGTFAGFIGVPDAPQLTGVREGTRLRLSWTQPAQPVTGYRIEYRISDGSWHELDEWYGPNELDEILGAETRPISFRIRAFSEGGTSGYSNVVTFGVSKRRAVR